jgi:predicted lipoprotein with Yx(FWY)xxD motif
MRRAVLSPLGLGAAAALLALAPTLALAHAARTAAATQIGVAQSKLGKMLVDSRGHSLYLFTRDTTSSSGCYGACAHTWLPLTATSSRAITAKAGSGLKSSSFGVLKRTDGKLQVTFDKHPMYTFRGDTKAGSLRGEGASQFSGRWYVVGTGGNAIKPKKGGANNCNTNPPPISCLPQNY